MVDYPIKVTLSDDLVPNLLGAGMLAHVQLSAAVFPNLAATVRAIAETAERMWLNYAQGATLPDGRSINARSGKYMESIKLAQHGDFSFEVFSVLPYAEAIEEGTPARDGKEILRTSLKVRINKKGQRYLIIPFRHNTPGSLQGNNMPESVHMWWQEPGRLPSHAHEAGQRVSGTGVFDMRSRERVTVAKWRYTWGTKLSRSDLQGLNLGEKEQKRLQGMYNFRKPGGKGGSSHSQFITFRVMSESSRGWQQPARAGFFPARTVRNALAPIAEEQMRAAVIEDIQAILAQAQGGLSS